MSLFRRAAAALLLIVMTMGALLLFGEGVASAAPRASPAASATPPVAHGLGVRLLDYPANEASDPRSHEYIIQTATPGSVITRHIEIDNNTGAAQQVRVYAGGASISGGVFVLDQTDQDTVSSWIRTSSPMVSLADKASAKIAVTITVPTDAARGEGYAVVWAELRSAPAAAGQIAVVNRVGIRVYLSVASNIAPQTPAFDIVSVTPSRTAAKVATLTAAVVNSGPVAVDISGSAELTDGPGATTAGPFTASRPLTLAPGQHGTVTIPMSAALAAGPWTATVDLRSGSLLREHTSQITFPGVAPVAAAPKAAPHSSLAVPIVVGGSVVVVGAGAGTAALLQVRARRIPRIRRRG